MKKAKLVFSPKVARFLLNHGMQIIDIKPDKNNKEKTIFVFDETDEFQSVLESYKTEKGESVHE